MADVGLGERITLYGRNRTKRLRNAVQDSIPVMKVLSDVSGIERAAGGRTVLDETLSGQNSTPSWVGEAGQVSLQNYRVADSPEYNWAYLLGSVGLTLAERYMNEGPGRMIEVYGAKQQALESSMKNIFAAGLLSSGTGAGGLQIDGLAALLSTTPTSGTVGGIDRSSSNAAWFRNQKFDSANDWSLGSVDAGNVKKFFDKLINLTSIDGVPSLHALFAGQTHFEYATDALGAMQVLQNVDGTGKAGFQKLRYRGVDIYYGGGINYSGQSQLTATRTYGICGDKGGFNVVYHKNAEFDMLPQVDASDQAAFSRLMFVMATTRLGGYAQRNIVGFD